jgi:hypothetical protein
MDKIYLQRDEPVSLHMVNSLLSFFWLINSLLSFTGLEVTFILILYTLI